MKLAYFYKVLFVVFLFGSCVRGNYEATLLYMDTPVCDASGVYSVDVTESGCSISGGVCLSSMSQEHPKGISSKTVCVANLSDIGVDFFVELIYSDTSCESGVSEYRVLKQQHCRQMGSYSCNTTHLTFSKYNTFDCSDEPLHAVSESIGQCVSNGGGNYAIKCLQ